MPFTNVWNSATPVDGQIANLLGADIRQLKLDIVERMNKIGIVNFTADPLVIRLPFYLTASAAQTHAFAAGAAATFSVTVTGAIVGDLAVASWKGDGTAAGMGLQFNAWVSAPDTVIVSCANHTALTITVTAETLIVGILRMLP